MDTRIGVVGLGYVGLPLALAFARNFEHVVGFDVNQAKVGRILKGEDPTDEGLEEAISSSSLKVTTNMSDLSACTFFIIGVPTPVDENNNPDLTAVKSASELVASVLKCGDVVVYESTVYPGVTEDVCGPILEARSGLKLGQDFFLGYSPERINPGDKEHTLEKIVKVVSGQDAPTLERVAAVYGKVVTAGVFRATSIKVAEAAKVIENTQRDLNIALMNELSIIFDKMGISTRDVLAAAGTKWNFLKFTPGLVGGHCIGVDPYYLTTKAELLGYHPQVILAGRRINDEMGKFVAQKTIKLLVQSGKQIKGARIGILGVTFKENVSDCRNSRVPDIYNELRDFGVDILVHDPHACSDECVHEYGITLSPRSDLSNLDALLLAVPHRSLLDLGVSYMQNLLKDPHSVFIDIKSAFRREDFPNNLYWSL